MLFFTTKATLKVTLMLACLALAACWPTSNARQIIAADAITPTSAAITPTSALTTDANLKVAFIGDSGYRAGFEAVLRLIKTEGADVVLHQGDFDYTHDAAGFFAKIDAILGPRFPYFAAVGNHDRASWNSGCGNPDGCYAQFLSERMERLGVTPDHPDLNDQMYSIDYRGLKIVFVGERRSARDTTYAAYLQSQLAGDQHTWKICSWHKNQHVMQLGDKRDEMGWAVYETCKNNGAIVATAHEHSYGRTKTLTSVEHQTVDTAQHPPVGGVPSNPDELLVAPGRSFVFVSGLGGQDMRNQDRCAPFSYPYGGGPGCNYMWAKIFTSDQTGGAEKFGALFLTFNYQGQPAKAHGYFKTTDGQIVDTFDITADMF